MSLFVSICRAMCGCVNNLEACESGRTCVFVCKHLRDARWPSKPIGRPAKGDWPRLFVCKHLRIPGCQAKQLGACEKVHDPCICLQTFEGPCVAV